MGKWYSGWWAAGLLALMAIPAGCGGGGADTPGPASRPDIVFILTDDLDADAVASMPQVQALIGDQGLRMERHMVSLSLCCPSRVTGLRGQFAHNTGIFSNDSQTGGFQTAHALGLETDTIATWLQQAGYRTALLGKYLNGYPRTAPSDTYIPPGWDDWASPVGGDPYSSYDYTLNVNGVKQVHGHDAADHLTDVIAGLALDFLERQWRERPQQPYLLMLTPYAPHSPANPAPRHADAFPGATAPRPPSFDEADVSDKPAWVQALPRLGDTQTAHIDALYRRRLQSLLAVDEMVGRLVERLRTAGRLSNTFIVFTSDNGYHMGQHRLLPGKATGYEEDLRVPLLVRGPGIAAGTRQTGLSANVDHAPTLAEIAGAAMPAWVDGRSLLPLWRGQAVSGWRQALLLEYRPANPDLQAAAADRTLEPPDPQERARGQAVLDQGFAGLRMADDTTVLLYDGGDAEHYDLRSDPWQLNNGHAALPASRQQQLATWIRRLQAASGADLRQLESAPP